MMMVMSDEGSKSTLEGSPTNVDHEDRDGGRATDGHEDVE